MRRSVMAVALLVALVLFMSGNLFAAPFYQGKTLRITVGFSAGGGFDLWARLFARHIGNMSRETQR
jgi:tripartite-type tricarboxylate transporter receptor subunit TctC